MAARRSRGGIVEDVDHQLLPLTSDSTIDESKERQCDAWSLARIILPVFLFLLAAYDFFSSSPPIVAPAAHAFAAATPNVELTVELMCKTSRGNFYVHDVDGRARCAAEDEVGAHERAWQRRVIDRGAGWFALKSRATQKWLSLGRTLVETKSSMIVELDVRLHWRFRRRSDESSSVRHLESRVDGSRIEAAPESMIVSSDPSPFALRVLSDKEIHESAQAADLARRDEARMYEETLAALKKGFQKKSDENKVISMGLYGSSDKYCVGAIRNAELAPIFFPGWKLRIYADKTTVPSHILEKLAELGVELKIIKTTQRSGDAAGMFWRFFVADDPSVQRFIVRDSDSRLNPRDAMAVLDWMNSGSAVHSVRDHPNHDRPLNGGMWGATSASKVSGKMKQLARGFLDKDSYGADLNFLDQEVYPM